MPEFDRLNGSSIGIELDFMEREQTPRELMERERLSDLPALLEREVVALEDLADAWNFGTPSQALTTAFVLLQS